MRLRRLLVRLMLAVVAAGMLLVVPLPELLAGVALPFAVTALVCAMGKALYDTLFYDHYQP